MKNHECCLTGSAPLSEVNAIMSKKLGMDEIVIMAMDVGRFTVIITILMVIIIITERISTSRGGVVVKRNPRKEKWTSCNQRTQETYGIGAS